MTWVNVGGAVSGGSTATSPYASAADLAAVRIPLATGSTTARSLADRFADVVNVKDFGAKGDGVDDTTALAAWAAASPTAVHVLPAGNYKTNSAIALSAGTTVRGASQDGTTITWTGAGEGAFYFTPGSLTTGLIEISDLTINATNVAQTMGIHLKNCTLNRIARVYFKGFSAGNNYAVWLDSNTYGTHITESFWSAFGGYGVYAAQPVGNITVSRCTFNAASTTLAALAFANGVSTLNIVVAGNNFEGAPDGNPAHAGNTAVQVGGSVNTIIRDNYFENWGGACVSANTAAGAYNLHVEGNDLHAFSTAAAMLVLNSAGPNDRLHLINNNFALLGNAAAAPLGAILGTTTNIFAIGNRAASGGTVLSVGGASQAGPDYVGLAGQLMPGTPAGAAQAARIFMASAAPVAGTFVVGDRVINNAPAVGQPKAWACTVAGTPGTWVSEGNL